MKIPLPIPEDIQKKFGYCPFTGAVFNLGRKKAASFVGVDGYISVCFKGSRYKSHRVAWFLLYGKQPLFVVDHIDRNKTNNSANNLRCLTPKQNSRNAKKCFIATEL